MKLLGVLVLVILSASALALHPANIPSAVAKIGADRSIELRVRFDILAFVLDMSPQEVADPPMLALLDGSPEAMQSRLGEAKTRFADSLELGWKPEAITFPTAKEVLDLAAQNGERRIPVMLAAVVTGHLPKELKQVSYRFPEVLGTVILTTEMPYQEPVSEPVSPGASSSRITIPNPEPDIQSAPVKTTVSAKTEKPAVKKKEVRPASKPARVFNEPIKPAPQTKIVSPKATAPRIAQPPVPTVEPKEPRRSNLSNYIALGFTHILPHGLDHILFVLGLFLLSRKAKALLTQVSAFTVAHSLTLGLALFGIVRLPSAVVEPVIAASIAFIAVENLFTQEMKAWRPFVVFGFGLVHGLGFAGALQETGIAKGDLLSALVGFNLGVEFGQLAVVALAFGAVGWFRSSPRYRHAVVIPASIAIAVIALFWTVQRIVA